MIQIDLRIFLRLVETNHQPVILTPFFVKRSRSQAKNPPKPVELETLEILPVDLNIFRRLWRWFLELERGCNKSWKKIEWYEMTWVIFLKTWRYQWSLEGKGLWWCGLHRSCLHLKLINLSRMLELYTWESVGLSSSNSFFARFQQFRENKNIQQCI